MQVFSYLKGVYIMKNTFVGELRKDNIRYYFEIKESDAYIEKTFITGGLKEDEHYGHFTVEQARKCYKALLNKGFKASK